MSWYRKNQRGERIISLSRVNQASHRKLQACGHLERFTAEIESDGLRHPKLPSQADVLAHAIDRYHRHLKQCLIRLGGRMPWLKPAIDDELERWDMRFRPVPPITPPPTYPQSDLEVVDNVATVPDPERFRPDPPEKYLL